MRRALLAVLPISLFFAGLPVLANAHDYPTPVSQNPFEGTWRSGNFAFTFYGNGRYVYVGVMGNSAMTSRISEQGTYSVVGNVLLVKRERGVVTTSANYRRDLPVETTEYPWQMGRIQGHLALQLVYPTGGAQVFYKE